MPDYNVGYPMTKRIVDDVKFLKSGTAANTATSNRPYSLESVDVEIFKLKGYPRHRKTPSLISEN